MATKLYTALKFVKYVSIDIALCLHSFGCLFLGPSSFLGNPKMTTFLNYEGYYVKKGILLKVSGFSIEGADRGGDTVLWRFPPL